LLYFVQFRFKPFPYCRETPRFRAPLQPIASQSTAKADKAESVSDDVVITDGIMSDGSGDPGRDRKWHRKAAKAKAAQGEGRSQGRRPLPNLYGNDRNRKAAEKDAD
jgi:hypothetical protein